MTTLDDIERAHFNGWEELGLNERQQIDFLLHQIAFQKQELSRQPRGRAVGGRKTETKIVTFWKVQRSNKLAIDDEELAERWDKLMTEMEDQGWKLAHVLSSGTPAYTDRLVFERPHSYKNQGELMFSMNTLLAELRKLLDSDVPYTGLQKHHIQKMPEGFTDWVQKVIDAIDPRCPSGHLISASEMALILMRVWTAACPDERLCRTWRESVRKSRKTGNGQWDEHMKHGVIDYIDDYMTDLGLDPGFEED